MTDLKSASATPTAEKKAPIDPFSPEGKAAIRAQAKDKVAEQIRVAERDRLLAEAIEEERIASGLQAPRPEAEEEVTVVIDLPETSAYINIDGRPYHHGISYSVPRSVAESLREIMFRSYRHVQVVAGDFVDPQVRRGASVSNKGSAQAPSAGFASFR